MAPHCSVLTWPHSMRPFSPASGFPPCASQQNHRVTPFSIEKKHLLAIPRLMSSQPVDRLDLFVLGVPASPLPCSLGMG